ncbi:hypothetical protein HQ584_07375 [Patescibacteria group bacterium]|nr:hypothetical protein [Patescibacteria group bacterium]
MKKDKKPAKPSFPIAVINFSKNGKVKKIVKPLPQIKDQIEKQMVKHFFNIMRKSRNFGQPIQNSENDLDFQIQEFLSDGTTDWVVEIVEIFDKNWRFQDIRRDEYFKELEDTYNKIQKGDKFLVIINDQYQKPPFPKIHSREGKKLVSQMKKNISSIPDKMRDVPDNILKRTTINQSFNLSVVKNPPKSVPKLTFPGGYMNYEGSDKNLLIETLRKKIEKRYQITSSQKVMLISYSTQKFYFISNEIKRKIRKVNNIFNEIWYFYPFVQKDRGHIEQLV